MKKVVIFGNQKWAEVVYCYLTHDSEYEVAGFTVDEEYLVEPTLFGLPVVPFGSVTHAFPPSRFEMMVSLSFQQMNQLRAEKFAKAREMGYHLINYVSSTAVTWPELNMGANCLVAEHAVVHPFVSLGNNVTIGANVAIGHHSVIHDHVFISPGAVILGGVTIDPYCVVAANACIREGIHVATSCLIGMGVSVQNDTEAGQVYVSARPELLGKSTDQLKAWLSW